MQSIDPAKVTQEYIAQQLANAEQISLEGLHAQYLRDQSPNKGTEEDYLERKLADGWRRSDDGKSIWRLMNATGGVTNTPDPSLYGKPDAANEDTLPDKRVLEKREPIEATNAPPAAKKSWIPKG
jgi:hypothetical protein